MRYYNSISKKLRKIDLFGRNLMFSEHDSQKHHTVIGFLVTIFIIVTCSIIGFMFGSEIYERKQPVVNIGDVSISADESRVNLTEVPIILDFRNAYGMQIPDIDKIFDLETYHAEIGADPNDSKYNFYYGFNKCNSSHYPEKFQKQIEDIISNGEYYCLLTHPDLYIKNIFTTPYSSFISFYFYKCTEAPGKTCHPDMDYYLSDMYFGTFFLSSFVSTKNFTNPVTYEWKSIASSIAPRLYKRLKLTLSRDLINTDEGWILESNKMFPFISLSQIDKEVSNLYGGVFSNLLFDLTLDSSLVITQYNRNYMKIQDLFAKIGGFFNAMTVFFTIILSDYIEFDHHINTYKVITERMRIHKNTFNKNQSQIVVKNALNGTFFKVKQSMNESKSQVKGPNASIINKIHSHIEDISKRQDDDDQEDDFIEENNVNERVTRKNRERAVKEYEEERDAYKESQNLQSNNNMISDVVPQYDNLINKDFQEGKLDVAKNVENSSQQIIIGQQPKLENRIQMLNSVNSHQLLKTNLKSAIKEERGNNEEGEKPSKCRKSVEIREIDENDAKKEELKDIEASKNNANQTDKKKIISSFSKILDKSKSEQREKNKSVAKLANLDTFEDIEDETPDYYVAYFLYDYICRKDKKTKKINTIKKIVSFHHYLYGVVDNNIEKL